MTKTHRHVYLSPHLDDAVLSCGGRIWRQTQAGARVLVVTVFAGKPSPDVPLSPFAQAMHAAWDLVDATAARREEDAAALTLLGAESVYWPYTDCIYRRTPDGGFPYASEEALFGEVHPSDEALIAELGARFRALALEPGSAVYAPLAVGCHVDHQIVRRAVAGLEGVTCYEDYPYAGKPGAVEAALGMARWQEEMVPLASDALEAKIAAIACYSSQFITLGWANAEEMAAAVRAFAERAFAQQTGGDESAERYWRLVRANHE
ncbi:MAG: PIG-L deacetylase family protein [Anaerolineae bacterium]|jgi:LmbE family N-acetylglucosaminyl deacetylase